MPGELTRSDFFVAVITLVPVLWITAGFASAAVSRVLRAIRDRHLTARYRLRRSVFFGPDVEIVFEPDRTLVEFRTLLFFGKWRQWVVYDRPGANQVSLAVATVLRTVFIVAGLVAEILSLIALYSRTDNEGVAQATLASALVVVVLAAGVLAVSLGAQHDEAFQPADDVNAADSSTEPAEQQTKRRSEQ